MDKPQQAEVVTIKEAVEKVKNWIKEKDFEKAKQGCEEILAIEKDNTEVKALLDEAKKGLGETEKEAAPATETKTETPATPEKVNEVMPKPAPQPEIKEKPKEEPKEEKTPTPDMIMKPEVKEENKNEPKPKKHFPLGKLIAIIILLGVAGVLVFAYIQGWLNPAFEWLLGILGL